MRSKLLYCALSVLFAFAPAAHAEDAEDAKRALEKIDSLLSDTKGYLADVVREQGDRAIDRLSSAVYKVKEVQSLAEEVKRKSGATDDQKRKGEKYYEAARAFLEAAQGLDRLKRAEIKLYAAQYPRTCEEENSKLKDFIGRLVDQKDHEGPAKLRDFAEKMAQPVREKIKAERSQESDLSSAYSTARRFQFSEDRWSDVQDKMEDSAEYSRDGWKRLMEETDRACEKIVKWEDNPLVRDGIRALGEKAKSKDEYIAEIGKQLEEAARALDGFERDSNDSDAQSAIRNAERIEDLLSRLRDVKGTDPKATRMTEKWPTEARNLREYCRVIGKMKERQYLIDGARAACEQVEKDLLALIKDLMEKEPVDQDRPEFKRQAKEAAARAGQTIAEKLKRAEDMQEELEDFHDKIHGFSPEDSEWKPVARNLIAASLATWDYYKNKLREAHTYCDQMTDPLGKNPAIRQAVWGDCSESQYQSLRDKVHPTCRRERSCKDLGTKDDCPEMRRRLQINEECIGARKDVMNTCFKGGDSAHRREVEAVERVRDVCAEKIRAVCN